MYISAIPVTNTITEKDVQVLIENEFSDIMGSVSVVHQGDCSNFAYTVTFITNRGDQAEMTVSIWLILWKPFEDFRGC